MRNLEIVGEATKLLSDQLRDQHPEVPWRSLAGVRDKMIHQYFGVDPQIVWHIVSDDFTSLLRQISRILEQKA